MAKNAMVATNSKAVTVYDGITDIVAFCNSMAKPFASLMNCSEEFGKIVALECVHGVMSPMAFQRTYHMIQGKPSMRSDAMLAEFRTRFGGDYDFDPKTDRTSERAAITLTDSKGRKYEFEYTAEEAKESRWPWKDWHDHSKGLKDNWATPTDRKSMLWARLVSDSLRAVCPELVAGTYTPEEMEDIIEGTILPAKPEPPTASEIIAKQKAAKETKPAAKEPEAPEEDVVEAEFTQAEEPPFDAEPETDSELLAEVRDLFLQVFADDAQKWIEAACQNRGVSVLHNMTDTQLHEIKDKLLSKLKVADQGN